MIIDRSEFELLLEESIPELEALSERTGRSDPHLQNILVQLRAAREATENGSLITSDLAERFNFGVQAMRILMGDDDEDLGFRLMNLADYLAQHLVTTGR